VDINPEYSDSLDAELFTVHLMFEKPTAETAADAASDFGRSNSVLPTFASYTVGQHGSLAFERGLEEICKYHSVDPEASKITALTGMGFPEHYSQAALRLCNNSMDHAAELIQRMKARATELDQGLGGGLRVAGGTSASPGSPSTRKTTSTVTAGLARLAGYGGNGSDLNSLRSGTTGETLISDSVGGVDLESASLDSVSLQGTVGSLVLSASEADDGPVCPECERDDAARRDQLISCTGCGQHFHTTCLSYRRIPFTLQTVKERENREKYIAKYYSTWTCRECSGGAAVADPASFGLGSPQSPGLAGSGAAHTQSPVPSHVQTKHDQAAALLGLLAASGLSMDALIGMGEEKQREALIAAATIHNSTRVGGDLDAAVAEIAAVQNDRHKHSEAPSSSQQQGSSAGAGSGSSSSSSVSMSYQTEASALPPPPADPRKAMMDIIAKRGAAAAAAEEAEAANSSYPSSSGVSAQDGSIRLKDDPKYGKYLKMIKVGLPKPAVAQKMFSEGVAASIDQALEILALDPDAPAPNSGGGGGAGAAAEERIALREHPTYSKYFKMLKVGLPRDAVKAKMQQEGVNPEMLERDPSELVPLRDHKGAGAGAAGGGSSLQDDSTAPVAGAGGAVAIADHPKYGKYFRMLKVGLPRDAIKAKMQHEGMNPAYLDKDPSELVPIDISSSNAASSSSSSSGGSSSSSSSGGGGNGAAADSSGGGNDEGVHGGGTKVAVAEHPLYAKYFKMMKVGLPKEAIKAKMQQEGANPSYLDKDPSELVFLTEPKGSDGGQAASLAAAKSKTSASSGAAGGAGDRGKPKLRKKKLYWKALDASQVGSNSLWADKDDDILLDEAEFNQLFVESNDDVQRRAQASGDANAGAGGGRMEGKLRKRVNLIDMKRGQNAGIALARIKMSFNDVKEKVSLMDDGAFTTDQLRSLSDYLPTSEEAALIKAFRGDPEMLGQAEKYMKVMTGFTSAAKRIQVMIYKQQFQSRVLECGATLRAIESACDDVKMSVRLKKVLKTILKVGNQMNDGEKHLGFTLDSLLKLQSAKAFDKKTSILQYVIMLIHRNDEKCLAFPEDLKHCAEASRLTLDSAQQEQVALRQGLEASLRVIAEIKSEDAAKNVPSSTASMAQFLVRARQSLDELDVKVENVRNKFTNLLSYFGEEAAMASQDFFTTLTTFVQEFVVARDNLDRVRRLEAKRTAREKEIKDKQQGRPVGRM
jgi:hypothetical protein